LFEIPWDNLKNLGAKVWARVLLSNALGISWTFGAIENFDMLVITLPNAASNFNLLNLTETHLLRKTFLTH